jgi:hypothetical protein
MTQSNPSTRYGIKLIYYEHLFPPKPYFERSLGPDQPALMNFSREPKGQALARSIGVGDRCLVYVTKVQLFVSAIEFIGTVEDGQKACKQHRIPPRAHFPFTVYLPIRFLARVIPWEKGPTLQSVCSTSGVSFAPSEGDSLVDLSESDYGRMYRAITWTHEYA